MNEKEQHLHHIEMEVRKCALCIVTGIIIWKIREIVAAVAHEIC